MKIKSILKLTILTCIFFGMIVFMTATPPKKVEATDGEILLSNMPKTIKLLDDEVGYATDSIIKDKTFIAVANHDSIILVKDLDQHLENFVVVSNISAAPWFVKEWIIPSKLKELKGEKKTPWIYDEDGSVKHYLQIRSDAATSFVILQRQGNKIQKVYQGNVKEGALDGLMTEDEIKKQLLDIISKIQK